MQLKLWNTYLMGARTQWIVILKKAIPRGHFAWMEKCMIYRIFPRQKGMDLIIQKRLFSIRQLGFNNFPSRDTIVASNYFLMKPNPGVETDKVAPIFDFLGSDIYLECYPRLLITHDDVVSSRLQFIFGDNKHRPLSYSQHLKWPCPFDLRGPMLISKQTWWVWKIQHGRYLFPI